MSASASATAAVRELLSELILEQRRQLACGETPHSDPHKLKLAAEGLAELIKPFKPRDLIDPSLLALAPTLRPALPSEP